jgi:hypothetical protein
MDSEVPRAEQSSGYEAKEEGKRERHFSYYLNEAERRLYPA